MGFVRVEKASKEIPNVSEILRENGVKIEEVDVVRATLEEAFLRLVKG